MIWFLLSCFFAAQTVHATSVYKQVLNNGLTVLVRPTSSSQKVSTQLWINVGSKHEHNNEKGLAHWLEHMFFNGTTMMSETDIDATTTKLSGRKNAATHYDWTHFYIDLPVQHWHEALPILADGMCNCTFKQDLMNSEVQVVMQELKMGKDHPGRCMFQAMNASIFHDHPYHYPVIGYKNDLKNLTREQLINFYKKYYVPSNAALVIVGNVDPQKAFELAEHYFGPIACQEKPAVPEFAHQEDMVQHSTTIYRHVHRPTVSMSYSIPGNKHNEPFIIDVIVSLLTHSRKAILNQRLIDELQLVNWVTITMADLFDYGVLSISFEPKRRKDTQKIISIIRQEIDALAQGEINQEYCSAVIKKMHLQHYAALESNHTQAALIGEVFLARQDENFFFERYLMENEQEICNKVQQFAATYLRQHAMHTGYILPLPEKEKETWNSLQQQSNAQDAQILADKQRQSPIEAPRYALTVHPQKPALESVPLPQTVRWDNGLTVYYYHNPSIETIELCLALKTSYYHQNDEQCGIFGIIFDMLQEGTKNYAKDELDDMLSKNCIDLHTRDGMIHMKMLKEDFPKAFKLLEEITVRPAFKKDALEKIKKLTVATMQRSPENIFNMAQRYFYGNHPYGTKFSSPETIESLTVKDLSAFHKQYFSPDGAALVIVGNLDGYDIPTMMQATIARWKKKEVPDIDWPAIVANTQSPTTFYDEREQVVLGLGAPSVARNHPDYYKLVLFDIVFHEKLFTLRSLSGAFYAFEGSTLFEAGEQPGLAGVVVNVSQTRVDEVETLLRTELPRIIASFNEQDLETAKLQLLNDASEAYATNSSMLHQFIGLHKNKLPLDYHIQRNKLVEHISVADVQEAAARILDPAKLVTFKLGRVQTK